MAATHRKFFIRHLARGRMYNRGLRKVHLRRCHVRRALNRQVNRYLRKGKEASVRGGETGGNGRK